MQRLFKGLCNKVAFYFKKHMDSRLRGNDTTFWKGKRGYCTAPTQFLIIPAKAGIHRTSQLKAPAVDCVYTLLVLRRSYKLRLAEETMKEMNSNVALVTGVSRLKGIGRAICRELAQKGFDIFFTYWTAYDNQMPWKVQPNEPAFIQQEIRDFGVRCEKLELDLTSKDAIENLLSEVTSRLGPPLVLVNNATYSTETTVEDLTAQELDKHYAVNLKATTLLTLAFIKQFPFTEHGRIINLSSGQSLGPMLNEIAYAVTKGAVETLTYTLYQELASRGITINAVNPGPNDTGYMSEKFKAELIKQFPMRRIGKPEDTARLIGFLASEDAEWVTGQVIHSEGGFKRGLMRKPD